MSNELKDTNRTFTADEMDKYRRELDLLGNTFENM
jgi:hypothetical protein